MNPEFLVWIGLAVCASIVAALYGRDRKRGAALAEMEKALLVSRAESAEGITALRREMDSVSKALREAEGRTSAAARPTRKQAIQLLRSGMPEEKAAAALGMALREVRLIGRVSRLLSAL